MPHDTWPGAFVTLAAGTIARVAAFGVKLIGIDSPLIDTQDAETLLAHDAVRAAGTRILEELVLDDLAAGDYELIALPIGLGHLDAAPVRDVPRRLA